MCIGVGWCALGWGVVVVVVVVVVVGVGWGGVGWGGVGWGGVGWCGVWWGDWLYCSLWTRSVLLMLDGSRCTNYIYFLVDLHITARSCCWEKITILFCYIKY